MSATMDEESKDSVRRGVGLAFVLHVLGLGLSTALVSLFDTASELPGLDPLIWVMNFGWTQAVYMVPAAIVLRAKRLPATLKGLLIVVGIGFMITSICTGTLMLQA